MRTALETQLTSMRDKANSENASREHESDFMLRSEQRFNHQSSQSKLSKQRGSYKQELAQTQQVLERKLNQERSAWSSEMDETQRLLQKKLDEQESRHQVRPFNTCLMRV